MDRASARPPEIEKRTAEQLLSLGVDFSKNGGRVLAIGPTSSKGKALVEFLQKTGLRPKKVVFIDFYATWCIPCKELDDKTFSDKRVAGELDRFTRVKADLTNAGDPVVQQLTRQYRIVGVPTVVLIDSKGTEHEALRLTGFEKAEPFLARLQRVR